MIIETLKENNVDWRVELQEIVVGLKDLKTNGKLHTIAEILLECLNLLPESNHLESGLLIRRGNFSVLFFNKHLDWLDMAYLYFGTDISSQQIALQFGVSRQAIDQRIEIVLTELINNLFGEYDLDAKDLIKQGRETKSFRDRVITPLRLISLKKFNGLSYQEALDGRALNGVMNHRRLNNTNKPSEIVEEYLGYPVPNNLEFIQWRLSRYRTILSNDYQVASIDQIQIVLESMSKRDFESLIRTEHIKTFNDFRKFLNLPNELTFEGILRLLQNEGIPAVRRQWNSNHDYYNHYIPNVFFDAAVNVIRNYSLELNLLP